MVNLWVLLAILRPCYGPIDLRRFLSISVSITPPESDQVAVSQLRLPSFRRELESSSTTLPPKSTQPIEKAESAKTDDSSDKIEPAKLVESILKGEYVDTCELLKDNIEAERKRSVSDNRVSGDPL